MLKTTEEHIRMMEKDYPGISKNIQHFEEMDLPSCARCGSDNTAIVQAGVIQRTINIMASTSKLKLVGNNPKPGEHFCNSCQRFY